MDTFKFLSLAEEYDTPLYIYDSEIIRDQYFTIRKSVPSQIEIFYAVKANPFQKVISLLSELRCGADVASGGELKFALDNEVPPTCINFTGPGKTEEELQNAVLSKVNISIESICELEKIDKIAKDVGQIAPVCVRINPLFKLRHSGLKMGGEESQFGIDEEQLPDFFEALSVCKNISFRGIHVFNGTQVLESKVLLENIENILDISERIQKEFSVTLKIINIGGGIGIPYFKNDGEFDIKSFGEGIKSLFKKKNVEEAFTKVRFFMELGRYLVGQSGYYLTKVLYKKNSRGKTFLIVDGGMHHFLSAVGMPGSFLRKNYHIENISSQKISKEETVDIAGSLCLSQDIMARDIILPESHAGDILCLYNAGAYGYSFSPLEFLSHKTPKQIFL
ncbi:MAG: diaminopimelate decarboxylase [Ignavibacteriae bacterium]|nr:diaminopimelate decarboxylase [Ignavibacteriota bacterium]